MHDQNCQFCQQDIEYIDYKNFELLKGFISSQRKIYSRRRTSLCKKHQGLLTIAIKRARVMAILQFNK